MIRRGTILCLFRIFVKRQLLTQNVVAVPKKGHGRGQDLGRGGGSSSSSSDDDDSNNNNHNDGSGDGSGNNDRPGAPRPIFPSGFFFLSSSFSFFRRGAGRQA